MRVYSCLCALSLKFASRFSLLHLHTQACLYVMKSVSEMLRHTCSHNPEEERNDIPVILTPSLSLSLWYAQHAHHSLCPHKPSRLRDLILFNKTWLHFFKHPSQPDTAENSVTIVSFLGLFVLPMTDVGSIQKTFIIFTHFTFKYRHSEVLVSSLYLFPLFDACLWADFLSVESLLLYPLPDI